MRSLLLALLTAFAVGVHAQATPAPEDEGEGEDIKAMNKAARTVFTQGKV